MTSLLPLVLFFVKLASKYHVPSDEEAIFSQRSGSQDSTANTSADTDPTDLLSPILTQRKQQQNSRSEKAKSPGSGVSWQTISAGRTEQRNAELQTLRTKLQNRGKSISFKSHVTTDDGQRIPLGRCCSEGKQNGARGRGRERSPPRTQEDVEPSRDEISEDRSEQEPGHTGESSPFHSLQNLTLADQRRRANSNPDPTSITIEPASDEERRPSSASGPLPDIRIQHVTNE